ncbi:hypothetical protein [Nocardioides panacisoli]|uniref:DUF3309 family protein n=1 Tax=Nocardioides panacisoli TaxID=627624 RepID=A0ABP7I0K7_9ACTN
MLWSPGFLVLPLLRRAPGLGFGLRHLLGGQAGTIVLLLLVLVVVAIVVIRNRR